RGPGLRTASLGWSLEAEAYRETIGPRLLVAQRVDGLAEVRALLPVDVLDRALGEGVERLADARRAAGAGLRAEPVGRDRGVVGRDDRLVEVAGVAGVDAVGVEQVDDLGPQIELDGLELEGVVDLDVGAQDVVGQEG